MAASPSSSLFPRAVAFIALVVAAQLWVNYHLGIGGETPWVALVIAALSGGVELLGRLDPAGLKRSADWIREAISHTLTLRTLVVLCAIFVVVALVVSSVMVIAESGSDGKSVNVILSSADNRVSRQDRLGPGGKFVQFAVPTNPFGRPFRLMVDGYLEQTLTVYPIVGAKVTPERDLRVSPSLLLRPPPIALRSLEDGGYLTLSWKQGGNTPLIAPDREHRGSFLIGRAQTIPDAKIAPWKLELEAGGFPPKLMSRTLLEWNSPKVLTTSPLLMPGMVVVAEVRSKADALVARAERTVSSERLIDVGMLPVEE